MACHCSINFLHIYRFARLGNRVAPEHVCQSDWQSKYYSRKSEAADVPKALSIYYSNKSFGTTVEFLYIEEAQI